MVWVICLYTIFFSFGFYGFAGCVCASRVYVLHLFCFVFLFAKLYSGCLFVCFLNRERTKAWNWLCGEVGKIWKEMREGKHWSEGIAWKKIHFQVKAKKTVCSLSLACSKCPSLPRLELLILVVRHIRRVLSRFSIQSWKWWVSYRVIVPTGMKWRPC